MKNTILLLWLLMLIFGLILVGCAHKRAVVPTPPAPTFGDADFGGKR